MLCYLADASPALPEELRCCGVGLGAAATICALGPVAWGMRFEELTRGSENAGHDTLPLSEAAWLGPDEKVGGLRPSWVIDVQQHFHTALFVCSP